MRQITPKANGNGHAASKRQPPPFPTRLFKHLLARYARENFTAREQREYADHIGVQLGDGEGSGKPREVMSPLDDVHGEDIAGPAGAACLRAALLIQHAAAELEYANIDENIDPSCLLPLDDTDKTIERLQCIVGDLTAAVGHAMIFGDKGGR